MSGSNPPSEADFLALQAQVTNLLNEINTLKAAAASASTSSGSSTAGGTSVATTTTTARLRIPAGFLHIPQDSFWSGFN
jgi:hypothetical protein